jgi:hypothetical protein
MNIREAILKAADHIEGNPGLFDFYGRDVPERDSPACALGWIGYFAGLKSGTCNGRVSDAVFGTLDTGTFYGRMASLCGSGWWMRNAKGCAQALRAYADTYHPAEPEISLTVQSELDRIFAATRERVAA